MYFFGATSLRVLILGSYTTAARNRQDYSLAFPLSGLPFAFTFALRFTFIAFVLRAIQPIVPVFAQTFLT